MSRAGAVKEPNQLAIFFRNLFGTNQKGDESEIEEMSIEEAKTGEAELAELKKSTKRINDMAKKYRIENFEVAEKTPRVKKSTMKTKGKTEINITPNKEIEEKSEEMEISEER